MNTTSDHSTSSLDLSFNKPELPDWLLNQSINKAINLNEQLSNAKNSNEIQDELFKTKEQLLDQQTSYIQMQTQHRQELEERNKQFNQSLSLVYREFQSALKNALNEQRNEFKQLLELQLNEQETRMKLRLKELTLKIQNDMNEKFEQKLVEFQENLIKQNESEFEDLEFKLKRLIDTSLKEERQKLKQQIEKLEKDLKLETEKNVQSFYLGQSESLKEQIKAGVMQEHLIHRDLINNKLEKLFRSSEEKRRKTNQLLARHMSGFNFFIDNAHKQLSILRDAHSDLLKNKDIIDYYGDEASKSIGELSMSTPSSASSANGPILSRKELDLSYVEFEKEHYFADENLLQDLSLT